jgi:glycogen debranching enzyme
MKRYVQTMAKYFDGFRLDNLHGTQLNVARWMIKEARKVKPEIIIFAELFTST